MSNHSQITQYTPEIWKLNCFCFGNVVSNASFGEIDKMQFLANDLLCQKQSSCLTHSHIHNTVAVHLTFV